jgi:hypothetical protein
VWDEDEITRSTKRFAQFFNGKIVKDEGLDNLDLGDLGSISAEEPTSPSTEIPNLPVAPVNGRGKQGSSGPESHSPSVSRTQLIPTNSFPGDVSNGEGMPNLDTTPAQPSIDPHLDDDDVPF